MKGGSLASELVMSKCRGGVYKAGHMKMFKKNGGAYGSSSSSNYARLNGGNSKKKTTKKKTSKKKTTTNSNNSNKKSEKRKQYKKINYKLSEEEIFNIRYVNPYIVKKYLPDKIEKMGEKDYNLSYLYEINNNIIKKILNSIKLKNYYYVGNFIFLATRININFVKFKINQIYHGDKTILIFLNVDKKLENKIKINFFGTKTKYKKTKKKKFIFFNKKEAIVEESFTPKRGDIIIFDCDLYYNIELETEKGVKIDKNDLTYAEIFLKKKN
jgi:hypothetical protein